MNAASPDPARATSPQEQALVGRTVERELVERLLKEAREGHGSAVLLEAPAGMGKTSLLRWAVEHAEQAGFRALWGYGLKEVSTSFFPFRQIFRAFRRSGGHGGPATIDPDSLPPVLLIEEERPQATFERAATLSRTRPTLLVSRERPATLRSRLPHLDAGASIVWLSKGEGEGRISPTNLDGLGDAIRRHVEVSKGGIVAFAGLDYLASHGGFPPVLHLLQFLRDLVEENGSHLLLSFYPASFAPREVAQLEGEGQVHRSGKAADPTGPGESPVATMIDFLDILEGEAHAQPVLLVLDDLHWCDPDSLRTFQFMARNLRKLPVLMLAARRTDEQRTTEEGADLALGETLAGLSQEGVLQRVAIGGLTSEEGRELISSLLSAPGRRVAESPGVQQLLERAAGNPFFLRETVRQLHQEGSLRIEGDRLEVDEGLDPGARRGSSMLPDSLRRLIARRLDRLHPSERKVLEWAAVAGSEFPLGPLSLAKGSTDVAPERVLLRLEREEQLVRRSPAGSAGPSWSFAHPLVCEVLLSDLPDTERMDRSRAVGAWWVQHRPGDVETIARLFHESDDASQGLPWVRRALDQALEARTPEIAERYARWLQDLLAREGKGSEDRVREGLEVVGRLFTTTGPCPEARHMLLSLRALGASSDLRREVDLYLALVSSTSAPSESRVILARWQEATGWMDRFPRHLALFRMTQAYLASAAGHEAERGELLKGLLPILPDLPTWMQVSTLYQLGVVRLLEGDAKAAREVETRIRALDVSTLTPRLLGYATHLQAFTAEIEGRMRTRREVDEAALALARAAGSSLTVAVGLYNLCEAYIDEGDLDGAERVLGDLRKHAARFGGRTVAFYLPLAHGNIELLRAHAAEARKYADQAISVMEAEGTGNSQFLGRVWVVRIFAYLRSGEIDRAEKEVRRLMSLEGGLPAQLRPLFRCSAGVLEVERGHIPEARSEFDRALELATAIGNLFMTGMAKSYRARWEEAYGDPAQAQRWAGEAREVFDQCGVVPHSWARDWALPFTGKPAVRTS